jgi:hypothetical protein
MRSRGLLSCRASCLCNVVVVIMLSPVTLKLLTIYTSQQSTVRHCNMFLCYANVRSQAAGGETYLTCQLELEMRSKCRVATYVNTIDFTLPCASSILLYQSLPNLSSSSPCSSYAGLNAPCWVFSAGFGCVSSVPPKLVYPRSYKTQ